MEETGQKGIYSFFNRIADKLLKLPKFVVLIVLALSFIYANIFGSMRNAQGYLAPLIGTNINIYLAIFLFGIVSWGLFELITAIYFWIVRSVMGAIEIYKDKPAMVDILRWFFVVQNLIFGSVRLLYFTNPLAILLTENILIFALSLTALILYYFFIRKKYIAPQLYPRSVMAFCAPYLLYMAVTLMTGALI
jgi:hypothetical protein